jgi:hypothetical protein
MFDQKLKLCFFILATMFILNDERKLIIKRIKSNEQALL